MHDFVTQWSLDATLRSMKVRRRVFGLTMGALLGAVVLAGIGAPARGSGVAAGKLTGVGALV